MNIKLGVGALVGAVALLALWQARKPSATLAQGTVDSPPSVALARTPAVHENQEEARSSMTHPFHQESIKPVSAENETPASATVINVNSGQGTIEPDSLSLRNIDFLDSDREFNKVAEALRLTASVEMIQRQRNYAAFFTKLPAVATAAVQVQDLLCGQRLCIGTVVGNQPQDLDVFFGSLSRTSSVDAPIYATAAVEAQINGATVRRFAFSTDPSFRDVPLRIDAPAR